MKNIDKLLELINNNIHHIQNNKKGVREIKEELSKYNITSSRVEEYLTNTNSLMDDLRELALFTEQVYVKTGLIEFNPENWFTEHEMKEARQFDYMLEFSGDKVDLPLEIENVNIVGNGVYVVSLDVKTIAKLMRNQLLNYNFEIQRQAQQVRRKDQFILNPTINQKNVKEIKELLLKDELVHTALAFNAAPQTSDIGEELVYDAKRNTLTITEGTRLDILDGYHRCLASEKAYTANPDLDFKFIVILSNYTTRQAQQYQSQLAKATPIPKARIQELEANRLADTVVQMLKAESELKGRVTSSKGKAILARGELVNYTVLSEAIDREFDMKVKLDTYEVAEYLTKFFEYLFGYYPEVFGHDAPTDNKTLMNYNKMFAGYIALASKMKKEGIPLNKLKLILDDIDFSRDNKLWVDLGVLDNESLISKRTDEKKIAKHFRDLNLSKLIS